MRKALIIPRNDGIAISMDELSKVVVVEMDAEQMLNMAQRCQQAGLEMLRKEKAEQLLVSNPSAESL